MRLINADRLEQEMYHNAFEITTDLQKWDSGCWIRYKMFENVIDEQPTVKAIPIAWIKSYIIPFQVFHDSLSEETKVNDGAGWVIDVLETMLREWGKENETD